jgi:prevent-host-death family protein
MSGHQERTEPAFIEPITVEEPRRIEEYDEVLNRVAVEHQPVVVSQRGVAVAAVISLDHLQLLQDALARQEAEGLAAKIDWSHLENAEPPALWLEGDEPKPF